MDVKVNSVYRGTIAIRQWHFIEALKRGEDLRVIVGEQEMVILHSQLQSRIFRISKKPYEDQFGDEPHYLIYYRWLPQGDTAPLRVLP